MSRSVLKIICIVSGILFGICSVLAIFSVVHTFRTVDAASVGIIGGADAPTYLFLLQKVAGSPVFYVPLLPLVLFIGTGLALIFCKKPQK